MNKRLSLLSRLIIWVFCFFVLFLAIGYNSESINAYVLPTVVVKKETTYGNLDKEFVFYVKAFKKNNIKLYPVYSDNHGMEPLGPDVTFETVDFYIDMTITFPDEVDEITIAIGNSDFVWDGDVCIKKFGAVSQQRSYKTFVFIV